MGHKWFQQFASKWEFPNNYTTIDLETNGVDETKNEICTIGYTVVRDRKPIATHELVLNWPEYEHIDQAIFKLDLQNAQRGMESRGDTFHHTYDFLKTHGLPPLEVLKHLLDLVEDIEERGELMIMHNGWKFDVEFIQAALHNHLGVVYELEGNSVYDSGICEKAAQLDDCDNPIPFEHETMKDWALRIGSLRRRGITWALHRHCESRYGLTKRADVPATDAHKGGADSLLIHHLFEEHRRLAELDGVT